MEKKLYLWDYSLVSAQPQRVENLIASHLLKFCHYLEDTEGYRVELSFIRDLQQREVDFLVCMNHKPWFAVEVKEGKTRTSSHLKFFQKTLAIPFAYQVVWDLDESYYHDGVFVMTPEDFLCALP